MGSFSRVGVTDDDVGHRDWNSCPSGPVLSNPRPYAVFCDVACLYSQFGYVDVA